jgi:hypothetical protein
MHTAKAGKHSKHSLDRQAKMNKEKRKKDLIFVLQAYDALHEITHLRLHIFLSP